MYKLYKTSSIVFIITAFFLIILAGCKKENNAVPLIPETGTLTDVENNIYKTVKIGNKWWMAEDLKVTKYRNGNSILKSQSDSSQWSNDTLGEYCDILDNNQNAIGQLYNWHAINNSNNLAPEGWHVPSDDEWKELEMYLGMNQNDADKTGWRGTDEGEKLKIAAPEGWIAYENVWGTNESGFTAIANGCRLYNNVWGYPGIKATGFWWSATNHPEEEAWYRYLDYKTSNIFRSHCSKNYGYSIRCVKD